MKHAIYELEGQLEGLLDKFCHCTEAGEAEHAARLSEVAEDFARALVILKEETGQQSGVGQTI